MNATAVLQMLTQKCVDWPQPRRGEQFVLPNYLDDILVYSETLEDHLTHLRKVIDRLMSANLKLKPAKCMFMRKRVEYFGHTITASGLKPQPHLTDAVQKFPTPDNVQAVRRFLGMTSYYRRFITNFAKIAQQLHHLMAKDVPFLWSPECEAAFVTLKDNVVIYTPCAGIPLLQ